MAPHLALHPSLPFLVEGLEIEDGDVELAMPPPKLLNKPELILRARLSTVLRVVRGRPPHLAHDHPPLRIRRLQDGIAGHDVGSSVFDALTLPVGMNVGQDEVNCTGKSFTAPTAYLPIAPFIPRLARNHGHANGPFDLPDVSDQLILCQIAPEQHFSASHSRRDVLVTLHRRDEAVDFPLIRCWGWTERRFLEDVNPKLPRDAGDRKQFVARAVGADEVRMATDDLHVLDDLQGEGVAPKLGAWLSLWGL